MTFTNEGSGETQDVAASLTIQGIQYQTEGSFCILGNQQHSDGDVSGTVTIKAFNDTGQTVLTTHNGHQYTELVCGTEHGLFAT
jgi:hypothetical protein